MNEVSKAPEQPDIVAEMERVARRTRRVSKAGWAVILSVIPVFALLMVLPQFDPPEEQVDILMIAGGSALLVGIALVLWPGWSMSWRRIRKIQQAQLPDVRMTGDSIDGVLQAVGGRTRRRASEALAKLLPLVVDPAASGVTYERAGSLRFVLRNPKRFPSFLIISVLNYAAQFGDGRFLADVHRLTYARGPEIAPFAEQCYQALRRREFVLHNGGSLLRPAEAVRQDVLLQPAEGAGCEKWLLQPADSLDD